MRVAVDPQELNEIYRAAYIQAADDGQPTWACESMAEDAVRLELEEPERECLPCMGCGSTDGCDGHCVR